MSDNKVFLIFLAKNGCIFSKKTCYNVSVDLWAKEKVTSFAFYFEQNKTNT